MKSHGTRWGGGATLIAAPALLALLLSAPAAYAQTAGAPANPPPPVPASAPAPAAQTVTLDVRDAPIRQVLIQLFDKAKIDYSLDNAVQGFVTLKVTDQPFETVLRLVLRSAKTPLTYSVTDKVYEIKPRVLLAVSSGPEYPRSETESAAIVPAGNGPHLAVINLTYLDPFDLQGLLGVVLIPSGSRGNGNTATGSGAPAPGGSGAGSGNGNGGNTLFGANGSNGAGGRILSTGGPSSPPSGR